MRPFVSVIVPCFNAEKTIQRTLESLANQTLKNLEIIVINDGSTDQTETIIHQFQEDHPDVLINLYSKENEGIAEARNFGLRKATGEYIGFLDSDDYTEPNMFEVLYEKAKEEDYDMVVSHFYWENSKGTVIQKEGPYELGPDMMVNLFAVLWNKIYRTDLLRYLDIQFPYGDRYEDACFLYCLTSQLQSIAFVDEPFVHYVQNETSITHTNNDQVKNMIDVFQIILNYYKEHYRYDEYKDALEYIHIKFFLGNSFLRSARIQDKQDRTQTILMGWDLLNDTFPNWRKNPYLKSMGGMKHRYFSMVHRWNLFLFAWVFRHFKKENL